MNIYQKLAEIRKKPAVQYIQKDAEVQGYKAITHDQVTSIVKPYLDEYGVLVVINQTGGEFRETKKVTKSGTPVTAYIGMYEISFVNIDNPEEEVLVTLGAVGEDQSDKGPGKAHSYATKYAMLKLLSIETGESDESRQELNPEPISEEQYVQLRELMESYFGEENTEPYLGRLAKTFGIKDITKLPANKFDFAVKRIEAKREDG